MILLDCRINRPLRVRLVITKSATSQHLTEAEQGGTGMDDRRFDSLVKALAAGTNRRSVLKGLLGIGGIAAVSSSIGQADVDAARRPSPTPSPPTCPGQQVFQDGQCACPPGLEKCGPDCCNSSAPKPSPDHSECCDNACCHGHCYGEELCCPWPRAFCPEAQECCNEGVSLCCGEAGCCDGNCCQDAQGNDHCCSGTTPKCCPGDTCIAADGCCDVSDCGPGDCWSCIDHQCVPDPAKCAGGCVECIEGTCQPVDSHCTDDNPCTINTCNSDGTCSSEFDCTLEGCGCTPSHMCFQATCDSSTGLCVESLFCANDELTPEEADTCCEEFGNPDPECLVLGECWPNHVPPDSTVVRVGDCEFLVRCGEVCCERYQSDSTFCGCVD
jgi:hypothetical protein